MREKMLAKPKGRPPNGQDGKACSWDALRGCWFEFDGREDTILRGAQRHKADRNRVAAAAFAGDEAAKRKREQERQRSQERRERVARWRATLSLVFLT